MVYCLKCGTKNKDSADFCFTCGTKISLYDDDSFEKKIEEFAEEIGRWGDRVGKKAEHIAKRIYDEVSGPKKSDVENSNGTEKLKEKELKPDAKYCIKCGAKYYGKPNFCYKCGNKI